MKSKLIESLNELLDRQDVSKNEVIRITGIDRSTFYKILKGDRTPTESQLTSILSSVMIDGKTLHSIIRQFVLEKQNLYEKDFLTFHRWMQRLARETSRNKPSSKPVHTRKAASRDETSINDALREFLAEEAGSDLLILMPAVLLTDGYIKPSIIEKFNAHIAAGSSKLLLTLSDSSDSAEKNHLWKKLDPLISIFAGAQTIENFTRIARYIRLPENQEWMSPFPWYMVSDHRILLIDHSIEHFVVSSDPALVAGYRERFPMLYDHALNTISVKWSMGDFLTEWYRYWEQTVQTGASCLCLNPKPCVWQIADEDELHRYMPTLSMALNQGAQEQPVAKQIDEKQVDAKQIDEKQVDAVQADVKQVDAVQADAKQVDAVQADAKQVDAVQADAKQVDMAHAEDFFRQYLKVFRQVNYMELVPCEGFQAFYDDQIDEIGIKIPVTDDDLKTTQNRLKAHIGGISEILADDDSSVVSSNWYFLLTPVDGVETLLAYPAWDESFIIHITDPEITKAYADWYHATWQISAMTRIVNDAQKAG